MQIINSTMKGFSVAFDMDGVLCEETRPMKDCKPMPKNIERLKQFMKEGARIYIYTGRFWADKKITEEWLKKHEIPYHKLIMGKLRVDLLIDDRVLHVNELKNYDDKVLYIAFGKNKRRIRR